MTEPPFHVVITAKEIYDAVVKLTGTVEVLISQQQDTKGDLSDHEIRIRTLEKSRWPLPALGIVLSLVSLGLVIIPLLTK